MKITSHIKSTLAGFLTILLILPGVLYMPACNQKKQKNTGITHQDSALAGRELIIFHAGSLAVPFKEMAARFSKKYTDVRCLLESAGSVASARKIIDLNRPCDIIAVSDYIVIDQLLIPEYTSWNICFASNELVIAFTEQSESWKSLDSTNWYLLLARKDVRFARSDPNQDPCGYRTVQMMELAEKHYGQRGIKSTFTSKDNEYIRPKEVDLLPLLETHTVDYIFIYRSVAEQHKLKYILLPDPINLKNPDLADLYASASVEIKGDEPGKTTVVTGQPMLYSVSILNKAPNRDLALKFTELLLSAEGKLVMELNGQPFVVPAYSASYDSIPESLQKFALKEK
jgi:molybdate/tungstate transport system substrate-binding protein